MVGDAPLLVHYWALLGGFAIATRVALLHGNITRTRNVSEYVPSLFTSCGFVVQQAVGFCGTLRTCCRPISVRFVADLLRTRSGSRFLVQNLDMSRC